MLLTLDDVSVRFGDTRAVDGVSLTVDDGDVVCVLGPSGSGKSTLLRTIAGLEVPLTGRVLLDGADIAAVPTHRRGFGLMFQDHALFPHRDVAQNVGFGLRMRGHRAAAEVRERVGDVLAQVGLAGFEHRAVTRLSGGEQQRVALARALAPAPRLLMLDEPLGSLDRALRERLVLELGALFDRLGVTVLYVTHDQAEAFALGSRVVLMRAGRVIQDGAPEEVWRAPVDESAARFLGFANVIDVTLDDDAMVTPWGRLPVRRRNAAGQGGARAIVRLDALALGRGPVTGKVSARTFRGDRFLVVVETDAGPALEVSVPSDRVPEVGDAVALSLDPDGVVVLGARGQPREGRGG